VHPNKSTYSETFIQAHIERLPANVKVLYGGYLPTHSSDDKPLLSSEPLHRFARGVLRRSLGLTSDHYYRRAFKDFLRRNRVDVVLAEYGLTGIAIMDACREVGVPLVVHFHGFDAYDQRVLAEFRDYYLQMFEGDACFIAASHSMREQLMKLGASADKVAVNPYGVDTSFFQMGHPATAPATFVSVGRFVDKKAPQLTLLAFRKALEECGGARLDMVGDGPLLEACQQMAKALGISSSVRFLGVRNPSEVADMLRNARALVQHSMSTSYGDSESLGVVFLEAGASGVPVIATRHDGIPEVVLDQETGLLVEEGDIAGMAECMRRLINDPILAEQLGRAARERICSEFRMERSIANLWCILEDVVQQHQS
jgi:glycosyltransferase involved in cell wall biosynthesis